jgi:hypothetical protein
MNRPSLSTVARSRRWTLAVAAGAGAVVMGACGGGGTSGGGSGAAPAAGPTSAGNNRLPGTQSTTDACTVVTQAEASAAMDEPSNAGQRGVKTSPTPVAAGPVMATLCSYQAKAVDGASLNVNIRSYPTVAAATAEFDSISKVGQSLPGIGDRAVISSGSVKGTATDELISQKGKVILDLLLTTSRSKQKDPQDALKALAQKAIVRV